MFWVWTDLAAGRGRAIFGAKSSAKGRSLLLRFSFRFWFLIFLSSCIFFSFVFLPMSYELGGKNNLSVLAWTDLVAGRGRAIFGAKSLAKGRSLLFTFSFRFWFLFFSFCLGFF